MSNTPTAPIRDGQRDKRGRFIKGNRGGPGNPIARKVAGIRAAMMDAVTPDDLRDMVKGLIDKAKGGDVAAFTALMDRLIGKPAPTIDPDNVRLAELKLLSELQYAETIAGMSPTTSDIVHPPGGWGDAESAESWDEVAALLGSCGDSEVE